jgi:hypothetical protein
MGLIPSSPGVSEWNGKLTSGGVQVCQSVWYGGDWASERHSRYGKSAETPWNVFGHDSMSIQHQPHWFWYPSALNIGCDPASGVVCQMGNNLWVHCLVTHTQNRHAPRDGIRRIFVGILQATLLKLICNAWNYTLHWECFHTCARHWDFVYRWDSAVGTRVLHPAPLGVYADAYTAHCQDFRDSWVELAKQCPLWLCGLRASGGFLKKDCELSNIWATHSWLQ